MTVLPPVPTLLPSLGWSLERRAGVRGTDTTAVCFTGKLIHAAAGNSLHFHLRVNVLHPTCLWNVQDSFTCTCTSPGDGL